MSGISSTGQTQLPHRGSSTQPLDANEPRMFPGVVSRRRRSSIAQRPASRDYDTQDGKEGEGYVFGRRGTIIASGGLVQQDGTSADDRMDGA